MTFKTGLLHHFEAVRVLVDLQGLVVTWSEVSWSLSSASTSIGVGATGTTSCALVHTGWSDGSITSSSLHHPPTQFFREKLFLEKGPDSRNNPYCFRIWDRRYTQLFWVSYEDAFIRFGFELISLKTFSHKHRSPKLLRNDNLGFSKRCRLNGITWYPIKVSVVVSNA